jgi:hypothetical protein
MPHKISRAKEVGSIAIGGTATGTVSTSTDKVTHCSQENEEITRKMCSPAADYCHPRKSNGSHPEATIGAG